MPFVTVYQSSRFRFRLRAVKRRRHGRPRGRGRVRWTLREVAWAHESVLTDGTIQTIEEEGEWRRVKGRCR